MSVTVIFEVTARAGCVDALKKLFRDTLPDTRRFPGCISVQSYNVHGQPDAVVMIETWATSGDYDTYLAWRGETGDMERLKNLVAAPPTIRFLDADKG